MTKKMSAVKKLMSESALNFRATLKYEELLIALENIIHRQGIRSPDNQTDESRDKHSNGSRSLTRRMTAKVREKMRTSESWTSHCKQLIYR